MSNSLQFRVQSHVLKLLGDELIGHDRLAVFELVKNAYDADATRVEVTLDLGAKPPMIVVCDNGSGMSKEIIETSWLEIGTDTKRSKGERRRSPAGRVLLGEKGVGRLAIQKLGDALKLTTRKQNEKEIEFLINWKTLIESSRYLGDGLRISIHERTQPKVFTVATGTRVEISELHRPEWTRREVRDLYRLISSLGNPFDDQGSFKVDLKLPGREAEVKDLPSLKQMLDAAVWNFEFVLNEAGILTWKYEFTPPKFKGLKGRTTQASEKLQLLPEDEDDEVPTSGSPKLEKKEKKIFADEDDLAGIGPIAGRFHAFHRRDEILKASGAPTQLKKWLDNQTGVRVYRDNIRVFNYGEPGEDWLGLDARRINRPAGKLGTQSVIAQVALDLAKSSSLKEKTNREGFDDNEGFQRLRRLVLSIFDRFHREHSSDRTDIDRALKGEEVIPPVQDALTKLELLGKEHKLEKQVQPILQSIQQELKTFRDVMVSSGLAGMNLALIFHEVVHSIDRIQVKLQVSTNPTEIKGEVDHLRKLLDTFRPLLQRDPARKVTAEDLVARASAIHADRFPRHKIVFSNWTADAEKKHSFTETLPRGLVVAAISNVIDNAIYWTRFRRERDGLNIPGAILILSHWDEEGGGMIAVVDNGPGFQLPRDQFARPFFSTRAGGMGLGVFYCKTVMESIGGQLDVMDPVELRNLVNIPAAYDGTAIVFSFKKQS